MAYHNQQGQITIDEVAARRDINNLRQAINVLDEMEKQVKEVQSLAHSFKGQYAIAQSNKAGELLVQIVKNRTRMEQAIARIENAVRKYQLLDKKLSEAISAGLGKMGSR